MYAIKSRDEHTTPSKISVTFAEIAVRQKQSSLSGQSGEVV